MSPHLDRQLFELTGSRAVAITFTDERPAGVPRARLPQPSGCSFWKLAAEGEAFYAEASDHYGCVVGAVTLGVELPNVQAEEFTALTSTLVTLSYMTAQQLTEIPRHPAPLRFVTYAPLSFCSALPDLVLVRGNARQLMLLTEAARAAGVFTGSPAMGRPACAIVPQALSTGEGILSLGCIGNRVYTSLGDNEGYLAIPGHAVESICAALTTIVEANDILERYHNERQNQFATIA